MVFSETTSLISSLFLLKAGTMLGMVQVCLTERVGMV